MDLYGFAKWIRTVMREDTLLLENAVYIQQVLFFPKQETHRYVIQSSRMIGTFRILVDSPDRFTEKFNYRTFRHTCHTTV